MPVSEAKKKANKKWNNAHSDSISMTVRKGVREKLHWLSDKAGLTMSGYIQAAVMEKMAHDGIASEKQIQTIWEEDPEGKWFEGID